MYEDNLSEYNIDDAINEDMRRRLKQNHHEKGDETEPHGSLLLEQLMKKKS